jgi:hypothetical protein
MNFCKTVDEPIHIDTTIRIGNQKRMIIWDQTR